ncbi:MAG: tyrosine--tRNA ligase [Alphaproteobacteria bacterium]
MAHFRSEFLNAIDGRGYLHQGTDLEGLDATAASGIVVAYVGFDATSVSLHAGHLLPIMLLRLLQRTGNKPIVLMGGGTTKVGDPTGKDSTRQLLSEEAIARNIASIRRTFDRFLEFGDGPTDAVMVDNAEWLDELRYIPFLRDYGRHFSVNRMLTFDNIRLRLEREQSLSFLEFNYMVLQAFDFLELNRRYGCIMQMGGSDQWGNIVAGIELARRIEGMTLYGLTAPLLTTATGSKMGKTEQGAVWLNPDQLSPYDYWQYWRNTHDADVGRFLRLFTDLPEAEIVRLEGLEGSELNEAKKTLATEATLLCHGAHAAAAAAETARRTFEEGGLGDELPTTGIPRDQLAAGIAVFAAVSRAGLAPSNSEARRLIRGGGVRVNDAVVSEENRELALGDLNADGVIKLSVGRKRHALIRPV